MHENFLGLPDILPDIYEATSSLNVVERHIVTLEKTLSQNLNNRNAMFLKNAFQQYHHCISQLGEKHRQLFFSLHQRIVKSHNTLHIKTIARTKSVIRFYQKCRRYLFMGKTIYDISDIFAGRIIIDSASLSEKELIELCYQIANESIDFMLSQGYLPIESSGVKDVTGCIDFELFPNIVIPEKSMMAPEYVKYCKDYIKNPKTKTGYQSLHIVFMNCYGERIELQIRTFNMDDCVENYELSSHNTYEELQNDGMPKLPIEREKIQKIPFYSYRYGKLNDDSGLEKSSPCMQETHRGGPSI